MIAQRLDLLCACSIAAQILSDSQRMRVKCIGLVSLPSGYLQPAVSKRIDKCVSAF